MNDVSVFDSRPCSLGEGPLWHPERGELYWFDINAKKLLGPNGSEWEFDAFVSAAGWVDKDQLLIASDRDLRVFDLSNGSSESILNLETEIADTRSNDGRADPFGGFWIGTMHVSASGAVGSIYRFYKGEVRKLYSAIEIPNSICFSPDGLWAYWTDTVDGRILKQALNQKDGWPVADPIEFANPKAEGWNPDGSVVDANGVLWNAQYGGYRVAGYDPSGQEIAAFTLPAKQATCPAFGGPGLADLFVTTAQQGMGTETLAVEPLNGQTFCISGVGNGQKEHRVILG